MSKSSLSSSREATGRGCVLAVSITLQADEKKLGKLLSSKRKREVCEDAEKRNANHRNKPEFLLPGTEGLSTNARHCAAKDDQPDHCKATPYLAVELGCMEAKSAEDVVHWDRGGLFLGSVLLFQGDANCFGKAYFRQM
jgi:hypothetical protein